MTFALEPRRIATCLLLTLLSAFGGCRGESICASEAACFEKAPPSDGGNGGVSPNQPTPPTGGGTAGAAGSDASPGGAPDDVLGGAGAGGESGASNSPSCSPGRADCDGSSLTPCETSLEISFQHCGACNSRCDGICWGGRCKPFEDLAPYDLNELVASASSAYALVNGYNFDQAILRIDLNSGHTEIIANGIGFDARLWLGNARLYAALGLTIVSMNLDGTGRVDESITPESFGATRAGAYYVDSVEATGNRLWFRSETSQTFQQIFTSPFDLRLEASDPTGVLMLQGGATPDQDQYVFIKDNQQIPLGPAPTGVIDRLIVGGSVALLVAPSTDPAQVELVWLAAGAEPIRIPLPRLAEDARLVRAPEGVALLGKDGLNRPLLLYDDDPPDEQPAIGIQTNTKLLLFDNNYLWYTWLGATDGRPHLVRAERLQLTDVRTK